VNEAFSGFPWGGERRMGPHWRWACHSTPQTLADGTDCDAFPAYLKQRRHRDVCLSDPEDIRLLKAITNGDHLVHGFRNRDLAPLD
jgi:hypothetical protein